MTIRPEQPLDHDAIADVVAAAFGSPAEARLVEAIRASANFVPKLSLVAEIQGHIVGYVMISFVALHGDGTRYRIANLSPLAVAPHHQKEGIGSAWSSRSLAEPIRGEPLVVLEGSPTFYRRLGFEHALPHGIEIPFPSWARPEAAQMLRLRNYDPSVRGRVVYPSAFDVVSEH